MGQGQFQHVLETVKKNRLNERGGGELVCASVHAHTCVSVLTWERRGERERLPMQSVCIIYSALQCSTFNLNFFWWGGFFILRVWEMQKQNHWWRNLQLTSDWVQPWNAHAHFEAYRKEKGNLKVRAIEMKSLLKQWTPHEQVIFYYTEVKFQESREAFIVLLPQFMLAGLMCNKLRPSSPHPHCEDVIIS